MDATANKVIRDLHEEAVECKYSKAAWKALLSQRLPKESLSIVSNQAQAGMNWLKQEDILSLAIREYPWMKNRITTTRKDLNGREHEVKQVAWIDRIREVGVVRPKDLIHLNAICELAENREAIEELDW